MRVEIVTDACGGRWLNFKNIKYVPSAAVFTKAICFMVLMKPKLGQVIIGGTGTKK